MTGPDEIHFRAKQGSGKYDDLCTHVRKAADAESVILIVFGGAKGGGFSVQATPQTIVRLPALLRELADGVEAELRSGIAFERE